MHFYLSLSWSVKAFVYAEWQSCGTSQKRKSKDQDSCWQSFQEPLEHFPLDLPGHQFKTRLWLCTLSMSNTGFSKDCNLFGKKKKKNCWLFCYENNQANYNKHISWHDIVIFPSFIGEIVHQTKSKAFLKSSLLLLSPLIIIHKP